MKLQIRISTLATLFAGVLAFSPCIAAMAADNELTPQEKAAGWKLLFDGKSLDGWRSYGKTNGPTKGWEVKDGILNCIAGAHGGDIITLEQFTDFDLQWDWRIPPRANNGIKYLVTEKRPKAPGHEYQMIDDTILTNHPKETTASF